MMCGQESKAAIRSSSVVVGTILSISLVCGASPAGAVDLLTLSSNPNNATVIIDQQVDSYTDFENFLDIIIDNGGNLTSHAGFASAPGGPDLPFGGGPPTPYFTINAGGAFTNLAGATFLSEKGSVFVNDGTVDNSGDLTIRAPLGITDHGQVQNRAGGVYTITGNIGSYHLAGQVINAGTFNASLATTAGMSIASFDNQAGGVLNIGTVLKVGSVTNQGLISNGLLLDIGWGGNAGNQGQVVSDGSIVNRLTVKIGSTSAILNGTAGTGSYQQNSTGTTPARTLVAGTLQAATIDIANGVVQGGGTLAGSVTIAPGAILSPGNLDLPAAFTAPEPPSTTLTVQGDTNLNGSLHLTLADDPLATTTPAPLIATVLDSSGTVNLGPASTLDLVSISTATPALGDSFDVLRAEVIGGTFGALNLLGLPAGLQWQTQYLTDAVGTQDLLRLSVVSAVPLPPPLWLLLSGMLLLFRRRTSTRTERAR